MPQFQWLMNEGGQERTTANDDVAGGLGFEPRLTESESAVLPLNYPPIGKRQSVSIASGARPRLVSCLLVSAGLERRGDAGTSRTSRLVFQARKARPLAWATRCLAIVPLSHRVARLQRQTPLTPCAGPTYRLPRWRWPRAHRRRRRGTPRAETHGRETGRRSRAPPCRRYESRW